MKTTKMFANQNMKAISKDYEERLEELNQKYEADQKKFALHLSELQMKCDRRDAKIGLLQHQISLVNE